MIFNNRKESENSLDPQIADEATEWLLSLEDKECEIHRDLSGRNARFLDWLKTSPDHVRAFLEISHAYYILSDADPGCFLHHVLPPQAPKPTRVAHQIGAWRFTRLAAGIAGAVTVASCTWLFASSFMVGQWSPMYYSTHIGERSIITFKDGSTLYLNTASRVELQSARNLRSARLLSGEALFLVSDPSKPFRLSVDDLQIESLGTQFDVRREATETQISVLDGRLRLSCDCSPGEMLVAAGEQLHIDHENGLARIERRTLTARERGSLITWRDGHLDFEGQSLADAAKEFNRYNRLQVVVGDADISDLKIGGTFLANDVESFIAAMHKTFGVQAQLVNTVGHDPNIVLLSKAPQATPPTH
jgi:transmembrane sensor